MSRRHRALMLFALIGLLGACGQAGDLYLPPEPRTIPVESTSPNNETSEEDDEDPAAG